MYSRVMKNSAPRDRIKFYGHGDLANYVIADKAVALLRAQSEVSLIDSLNDAVEIYNAMEFERHGVLPNTLTEDEQLALKASRRRLNSQIAGFFATIDDTNVDAHLAGLERKYVRDLFQLIDRFNLARNVGAAKLFDAFVRAGIPLWAMLGSKSFVRSHDQRLRTVLLSDARHGELLVNSRLLKNSSDVYFLPASLSADDSQQLLKRYINSESPHLNYVEAIANARDDSDSGITKKVRLAAKRRLVELTQALFADKTNTIGGTSYALSVDPVQEEPRRDKVEFAGKRRLYHRTFGYYYLKCSTRPDQVLANFATIIGYSTGRGLLSLPSFRSQISVVEGLLIAGKETYPRGGAYRHLDSLTFLGTEAYYDFLQQEGVEVEDVIARYFRDYVPEVFGISGFEFAPSTVNSKFLERCRQLCAEMESIAKQFALYCEEGEVDRALLEIASTPSLWASIPSLIKRKYLVQGANDECRAALNLLFSDQSRINYVNKDLQAKNFVQLVLNNQVKYGDLHHYQNEPVDWLIAAGLVSVDDGVICLTSLPKIQVLSDVRRYEAGPFEHYSFERTAAETLAAKGWLEFRSTLLSPAEASYFNFYLNNREFSDGEDLRNRYLHGTNPNPRDEEAHRKSYMQLIRLTVALVLKIHDDFALYAGETSDATAAAS